MISSGSWLLLPTDWFILASSLLCTGSRESVQQEQAQCWRNGPKYLMQLSEIPITSTGSHGRFKMRHLILLDWKKTRRRHFSKFSSMPEIPLENMSIRQLCVADFYFWLVELFFFSFCYLWIYHYYSIRTKTLRHVHVIQIHLWKFVKQLKVPIKISLSCQCISLDTGEDGLIQNIIQSK